MVRVSKKFIVGSYSLILGYFFAFLTAGILMMICFSSYELESKITVGGILFSIFFTFSFLLCGYSTYKRTKKERSFFYYNSLALIYMGIYSVVESIMFYLFEYRMHQQFVLPLILVLSFIASIAYIINGIYFMKAFRFLSNRRVRIISIFILLSSLVFFVLMIILASFAMNVAPEYAGQEVVKDNNIEGHSAADMALVITGNLFLLTLVLGLIMLAGSIIAGIVEKRRLIREEKEKMISEKRKGKERK